MVSLQLDAKRLRIVRFELDCLADVVRARLVIPIAMEVECPGRAEQCQNLTRAVRDVVPELRFSSWPVGPCPESPEPGMRVRRGSHHDGHLRHWQVDLA